MAGPGVFVLTVPYTFYRGTGAQSDCTDAVEPPFTVAQIATLLFASERKDEPFSVFLVCAGALVLGTAIAVCLGAFGGRYMQNVPLKLVAGIGFIVIGVWSVVQYYQGE